MTEIRCGHCWKVLRDDEEPEEHFDYCKGLKKKKMTAESNSKIQCDKCGKWFSPGNYVHHPCIVNKAPEILSRHMEKLKNKKRKGFIANDIGQVGVFPQTEATIEQRTEDLKFWAGYLAEKRGQRIQKVVSTLRHVLLAKRLKGRLKEKFKKDHAELNRMTAPGGSVLGMG